MKDGSITKDIALPGTGPEDELTRQALPLKVRPGGVAASHPPLLVFSFPWPVRLLQTGPSPHYSEE